MLQCGDPSGSGQQGPGYFVEDELPQPDPRLTGCQDQGGAKLCTYPPGTLAMAQGRRRHGPADPGHRGFAVLPRLRQLAPAGGLRGVRPDDGVRAPAVVKKIAAAGAQPADANGNTAPKLSTTITSVK